jgi:uncharacterized membrane protein YhhN
MNKIRTIAMFVPYLVVCVIHLVALAVGVTSISSFTKPFLMVLLLVAFLFLLPRVRGEVALLGSLGILLSWIGDVTLSSPEDLGFLIGLGFFLLAHVAYVILFLRGLRVHRLRPLAVVYPGWLIVFIVILAPHLGSLLIPVVVYGLVLCLMGASALRCNRWIAVGGGLFVISDSLLGLSNFLPGFHLWQSDFLIMFTYLSAQGLIAFGALRWAWAKRARDPESVGAAPSTA